jgi:hypothetical protein
MLKFDQQSLPITLALCNPGVASWTLTCFYACAAVNWFRNKVNQFTWHVPCMKPGLHKAVHVGGNFSVSTF